MISGGWTYLSLDLHRWSIGEIQSETRCLHPGKKLCDSTFNANEGIFVVLYFEEEKVIITLVNIDELEYPP